jgi:hypothetical protein
MSGFDDLFKSDVQPKTEEVKLKVGEKTLTFTANEISYLQRLHLSQLQSQGGEAFTQLIVYSITDADGQHMTREQANRLPSEYAEQLFIAATKVNSGEVKTEKN